MNRSNRAAFAVSLIIAFTLLFVFIVAEQGNTFATGGAIMRYVVLLALILILFLNLFLLYRDQRHLEKQIIEHGSIISNLNVGLIEYSENLKIKYVNPKALELMGLEDRVLLNLEMSTDLVNTAPHLKTLIYLFYPVLAPEHHFIPQKTRYPQIVEIVIKEPKEITLSIATVPLVSSRGENLGFLKIITDISRERAIAKVKSEFISVTAHQLRTPLSAIKWILKMVMDGDTGPVNEKQAEYLGKGYESNERLIRLVNDLLNVARIEEGRFGYRFEMGDLVDLIKRTVMEFQPQAQAKGIKLLFEESKEFVPHILMDAQRIMLLVQNLIGNSMNYTKQGSIKITISLKDGYIQCAVRDTGLGIPEAQKTRIFSKFFRADNAIHQQTEGTGLGLFIARNIVVRHGGSIWFESEEGKGTTFYFTLPVESEMIPNQELFLEEGI